MFFFYIILIIIFLLTIFTVFTTIQIQIKNVRFSTDKIEGRYLNKNYKIIVKLYLFEKIKYLELNIMKNNLEEKVVRKNVDKLKRKMIKDRQDFDIKILKSLKYLNLKIKQIRLNLYIGLEDAAVAAISVGSLSSIFSILFRKCMEENHSNYWKITPVYQNRNLLKIDLDCIFQLKLIHIIYTIYVLNKKGEKNGRTSNRRAYAHSNE